MELPLVVRVDDDEGAVLVLAKLGAVDDVPLAATEGAANALGDALLFTRPPEG